MKSNKKLIQGNLESLVLKMIQDNGEMYAYEIIQTAQKITRNKINITEGALYPLLHKLEEKNILEIEIRSIGNRKRKYYKLTETGKKETQKQLHALREFIETMQIFLKPKYKPI